MKYNQALIVVKDMNKSVKFYCEVLGQKVVSDFGANKTLAGGFSLQTLETWKEFIQKEESDILFCNNACELYFEEDDMDTFLQKLKSFPNIKFVHDIKKHSWGQRVIRFYDPDMHIIEVGENIISVIMRFINSGLTIEKTAKRMDVPLDFVAESIKTNNRQNDKDLCDMSLIEMWALFPISLTAHNENWKSWYIEEHERLLQILPQAPTLRVSHIGSTAIAEIMAKPIVDILVEIDKTCNIKDIKTLLENNGYGCMSECADRISMQKGYTKNGLAERVFHLHLRFWGDNDELYFRDYLTENAPVAKEYETLKLALLKQYKYNRDAYTNAKTDFISKITSLSKVEYKDKYK